MGIATAYARPYYMFTRWLRGMGVRFDVLEPQDAPRYDGHIILTTHREAPRPCRCALLYPDELELGSAVAVSLLLQRCGLPENDLVVGIDPGKRFGLAVSYGGLEVEASLHTNVVALVSHVATLFGSIRATGRTIRIGNGQTAAARVCRALSSAGMPPFHHEFVEEAGTSPRCRNCNSRGKRDMEAARAIAGYGCILPAAAG